jgi:hypothetical protein
MIEPTIGRVVWYRPDDSMNDQPLAALVAYVHGPRSVNLAVFDPNGIAFNRTYITLRQEGDDLPQRPFCEWMPYQIGQAKKHT